MGKECAQHGIKHSICTHFPFGLSKHEGRSREKEEKGMGGEKQGFTLRGSASGLAAVAARAALRRARACWSTVNLMASAAALVRR